MPQASIIIVAYNSGQWLNRSIESVKNQTVSDFECFIVDNGSTDGSFDDELPIDHRFEIIRAGRNLGFAAGNNLAARQAKAPWIALLNPDAFAHSDWLENLLKATQLRDNIRMVGSLQYLALEPDRLDGMGDFYHVSGLAWRGGFGHKIPATIADYSYAFAPCGAGALYHHSTFSRLGGFDETFFCYHEDVDLAYRIRLDGGECVQANRAKIDHISSGISGRASSFAIFHGTRNRIWTFVKNTPPILLPILTPLHICVNMLFLFTALFRPARLRPRWQGIIDALRGLPSVWRTRKTIQTSRKISSLSLLSAFTWSPIPVIRRAVPNIQTPIFSDKPPS